MVACGRRFGGPLTMLGVGTGVAALIGSGSIAFAYLCMRQGDGLFPVQNQTHRADGIRATGVSRGNRSVS
ncbi:hypothetical protein EF294_13065 [Gordonia oryzae]|uniref:Uncharacterized protein n=2 Tax=Gordonia oryzae TaxID=2487349 RepID=A0A3N4G9J9_9ACTN|nr:hypothetical protein EF294_13065 [Gordonia oryzae]